MHHSGVLLFALFLSACGGDAGPKGSKLSAELGIDSAALTRTPSGLQYQEVAPGSGAAAKPGQIAVVHYTGWLTDGTKFDSSRDRGEPFSFPIGVGQVIPGWDEGVAGMKAGGRRRLVIPSDLAYGPEGSPPVIPPDATLVFDVELVELR
jgi:peptidylprolyl isomerase